MVGVNCTYGSWESAVRMCKSIDGEQYNKVGHCNTVEHKEGKSK